MNFPYIFHRYIHLFPNGEHAKMDVWIHSNEVMHPATLKGKPSDPNLQREFDAWQKFAFQNIEQTKAVRLTAEQLESPTPSNRTEC
jgi:hypothetical protein